MGGIRKMNKKILKSKKREDGIEFKLYEYFGGKVFKIIMLNTADGQMSEYGGYTIKEEALNDFDKIV